MLERRVGAKGNSVYYSKSCWPCFYEFGRALSRGVRALVMRLKRALGSLGAPHGDAGGVQRLCTRVPTVERLLTSDLELLARDCGLDHSELKRLATTVAAASVPPVRTARQVLAARRAEAPLLSTGVPALDALLKGGLRAGEVCELIGAPGSGKTAACVAARVDM